MNKKDFWNYIEPYFDKAEELGIAFKSLCYRKKGGSDIDIVELDYRQFGLDFQGLISILEELEKDGLIKLEDTDNMGYFIYKK